MTQTIAQNILINNRANNRKTNYGKHSLQTFNDLDENIENSLVYNAVLNKLDKLESTYDKTLEELDILISNTRQTALSLKNEKDLLNLIDTYTYIVPNKAPFITLINTINTLIQECNTIINNINTRAVSNINVYTNEIVLNSISSSVEALVSKEWLANYINGIPKIPKVRRVNSTLICNSAGEIVWA